MPSIHPQGGACLLDCSVKLSCFKPQSSPFRTACTHCLTGWAHVGGQLEGLRGGDAFGARARARPPRRIRGRRPRLEQEWRLRLGLRRHQNALSESSGARFCIVMHGELSSKHA